MGRPPDTLDTPQLPALEKWPRAPKHFSDAEKIAWKEIGRAVMAAGVATAADLLIAEEAARIKARIAAMYVDGTKATTLGSWLRLLKENLIQLGLTPQARKSVTKAVQAVPDDKADPLSEFA